MRLGASRGRLSNATKQLFSSWKEARKDWRDAKARQFEEKYLVDLKDSVERSLIVMEELDKVLDQIRKDCE